MKRPRLSPLRNELGFQHACSTFIQLSIGGDQIFQMLEQCLSKVSVNAAISRLDERNRKSCWIF